MARPEERWRALADDLPEMQAATERALLRAYSRALEKIVADIQAYAQAYKTGAAPQLVRLIDLQERVSRQIEALTGHAIATTQAARIAMINRAVIMAREAFQAGGVPIGTWSVFSPAAVEAAVFSPYQTVGAIKTFPALNDLADQAGGTYSGMPAGQVYYSTRDAVPGTAEFALHRTATVLMARVWESTQDAIIRGLGQDALARQIRDVYKGSAFYVARRVARTEIHRAQIVGLSVAGAQLEAAGAQIKRYWMATDDERTRDSHADMDGVFEDDDGGWTMQSGDYAGEKVDAPGLSAHPEEAINCRCTIGFHVEWYGDDPRKSRGEKQLDE